MNLYVAPADRVAYVIPNGTSNVFVAAGRFVVLTESIRASLFPAVPLGLAAVAIQQSIYDVPGGYRAVMFDRFQGVKDKVRLV